MEKELYEAPVMEVIEVKTEGVICGSGAQQNYEFPGYGPQYPI